MTVGLVLAMLAPVTAGQLAMMDSAERSIAPATDEVVVLLHGLTRSRGSMKRLERHLVRAGYRVVNMAYPSAGQPVEALAEGPLAEVVDRCCRAQGTTVHFVTHSIGGIVVRAYLKEHPLPNLGRVVMLTPPSQGTELADRLRGHSFLEALLGPAGLQMTTAADGFPRSLGPVDYELGVIAGSRSINPFFSRLIPGPDDGVIAVERTRVEGMTAFLVLPYSHTFIMIRSDVISQVIHFLQKGAFAAEGPHE